MLCKSCNTRLDDGTRVCPNCGHQETYLGQTGSGARGNRPAPAAGPASSSSRLSPSMYSPRKKAEADDLELEDAVEPSRPAAQAMSGRKPAPRPAARPSAPPTRNPSSSGSASRSRPAAPPQPASMGFDSDLSLEPDQLLSIVCEDPELLEPGLQVYEDNAGKPLGIGFSTDVGDIDLLARSADGGWVIVYFDDGQTDIMAAMLMRMGWVRKHLVKDGEGVRAIVIAERVDPEVGYAAAAMADSIEFKSCRLTLRFDSISV